ncbi:hypothetical protein PI95_013890 [Hassallia byssoidea VB512170]|uniref:Uncharacterized protein n=1 Tax=Hassallia byssoidea VB512170 TaxID=1304833 RepID=A0A846H971_9CYAN|nr:hypothetical protein [Hassalia byssoidea]NEU73623.1 hypothetical protein [Hassalia byssoidea VB512170]
MKAVHSCPELAQGQKNLHATDTNLGETTIRIASSSIKYQAKSAAQSIKRHFRCQAVSFDCANFQFVVACSRIKLCL